MKRLSIKLKVTLWFTLLMVIMAVLMLGFMLTISSSVVSGSAQTQLSQTVRGNLTRVSMEEGKLQVSQDFKFYQDGIYTLIYNKDGALLAGQVPLSFTVDAPFENGLTRQVESEGETYYLTDFWLQLGWEEGVWLRGILPSPGGGNVVGSILRVSFIALPFLVVLAAVGGYVLARRAFRPIDRIVAAANEISEAKDLSGRIGLPQGRDELSRLSEAFDRMFERLERSFEAEKQFTSDASHELRTPTAVILAQCDYARRHGESRADDQEALEVIERQAQRMSRLINQLLNITRLEQGTERAAFESADLSELVSVILREQPPDARGITLSGGVQEGIYAKIDVSLMTRLIQNLIDNAFQYGRPGGRVHVTLREEGKDILLSVEDDGPGILPEEQEKIWKRFYQVDPSRSSGGSMGLGLYMVRQIAGLHGGEISLKSAPGEGSVFTLRLPKEQGGGKNIGLVKEKN